MARKNTEKNGNGDTLGLEPKLFKAADKLRGNMEPSDYKHVALGLIFLKYISDAFEAKHKALMAEDPLAAEDRDEYVANKDYACPALNKVMFGKLVNLISGELQISDVGKFLGGVIR